MPSMLSRLYRAKLPAIGTVGAVVAQQEKLVVRKIPSDVVQPDYGWQTAQVVLVQRAAIDQKDTFGLTDALTGQADHAL